MVINRLLDDNLSYYNRLDNKHNVKHNGDIPSYDSDISNDDSFMYNSPANSPKRSDSSKHEQSTNPPKHSDSSESNFPKSDNALSKLMLPLSSRQIFKWSLIRSILSAAFIAGSLTSIYFILDDLYKIKNWTEMFFAWIQVTAVLFAIFMVIMMCLHYCGSCHKLWVSYLYEQHNKRVRYKYISLMFVKFVLKMRLTTCEYVCINCHVHKFSQKRKYSIISKAYATVIEEEKKSTDSHSGSNFTQIST